MDGTGYDGYDCGRLLLDRGGLDKVLATSVPLDVFLYGIVHYCAHAAELLRLSLLILGLCIVAF